MFRSKLCTLLLGLFFFRRRRINFNMSSIFDQLQRALQIERFSRRNFDEHMLALSVRILGDKLPTKNVDAIYAFSQTRDNEVEMVRKLKVLSGLYPEALILLTGEDGSRQCGWAGCALFIQLLKDAGIPTRRIETVPFPECDRTINTLSESRALLNFCTVRKLSRIVIVSPPFHQLRSTATLVSCLIADYRTNLRVYSSAALPMNWIEEATHSQGKLRGTRSSLVYEEIKRLRIYYRKGDLKHPRDIFHRLDSQAAKDEGDDSAGMCRKLKNSYRPELSLLHTSCGLDHGTIEST
jgi:hypothetical protein